MLKAVRAFSIIFALLIALPIAALSADKEVHPKKYGVEFQMGGGYYGMADVNDLVADPRLVGFTADEIHIGSQLGIAISYRAEENFGYQIGFNRLFAGVPVALEHTYKVEGALPGAVNISTVEQKVDGSEYYVLASWYTLWNEAEVNFSIGPAIYKASLDRSAILYSPDAIAIEGANFVNATGKALGLITSVGIEFMVGENTGFIIQGGGRLAKVGKIRYETEEVDPEDPTKKIIVRNSVPLNSYSNASLPVDFSGGFVKLSFRTYFKPGSDWRSPTRH